MSFGQPKIRIIKPSRKFAQKAINIAFSQLRLLVAEIEQPQVIRFKISFAIISFFKKYWVQRPQSRDYIF